jgi:hypothetical protein
MPQPTLMPWLAVLTRDSSMPSEVEVMAGGERLAQAALHQPLGEAELLDEVALVVGRWDGYFVCLGQGHTSILGFRVVHGK